MKKEGPYKKQSSADRKEALYHDIIDYFNRGKVMCSISFLVLFIIICSYGNVELSSVKSYVNNMRRSLTTITS